MKSSSMAKPANSGEVRYLLSPQDLAAVDLIPDLVRAGVKSFKIEGRLKSPEYVTAVTRVYRKALDAAIASAVTGHSGRPLCAGDDILPRPLHRLAGGHGPPVSHARPLRQKARAAVRRNHRLRPRMDQTWKTTGVPIAAGDGVVFDAGENRDLEQGARIWKIEGDRIIFHRTYSGINFERIQAGHTVYKTSDPKLESELRKFWQNAKPAEKKTPLIYSHRQTGKPPDCSGGL
jgi:U32 family peptidase